MNEKIIERVKAAKNADEILALAKENNMEITSKEAEEIFELAGKKDEISDEELANVSGGGCKTEVNGKKYEIVSSGLECFTSEYECNVELIQRYHDFLEYKLIYAEDHASLRKTWAALTGLTTHPCGSCRWLGFKGATGYCSKS